MNNEFLWVEKYRPKTVKDTVLPDNLKKVFQQYVDQKNIPNLILAGPPGCGKTTVARAMLEELGCDYIIINGSMNGNIDTLRNDIMQFASTVSLVGGRKYIIIDEADYLNANSTQPALRNFMETYSKNCGFILTCNYKNRILKELHSRSPVVEFNIPKQSEIAKQIFTRIKHILKEESVEYDSKVLLELIKKHYPDWRRIINELQTYSVSGRIDTGILSSITETTFNELASRLRDKDFTLARKWVAENSDIDSSTLFRMLYDKMSKYIEKNSIPQLVLILAKYQYQAAFVADPEINTMACLTEIMMEVHFQ